MMSQSTRHSLVTAAAAALTLLGCNAEGDKAASPPAGPKEETVATAKDTLKAAQVCVTLQRGGEGNAADAMINEEPSSINANYGALSQIHAGVSGGTQRRSLFRWDVSSIPPAANILSAGVSFSMSSTASATMRLHLVKVPWTESTVSWASFNNGFKNGVGTLYISNTQQLEGVWKQGKLEGPAVWMDGDQKKHQLWENGKLVQEK